MTQFPTDGSRPPNMELLRPAHVLPASSGTGEYCTDFVAPTEAGLVEVTATVTDIKDAGYKPTDADMQTALHRFSDDEATTLPKAAATPEKSPPFMRRMLVAGAIAGVAAYGGPRIVESMVVRAGKDLSTSTKTLTENEARTDAKIAKHVRDTGTFPTQGR